MLATFVDQLLARDWAIVDGLVTHSCVQALRAEAQKQQRAGRFHVAGIGRGKDRTVRAAVRSDRIAWFDEPPTLAQTQWLEQLEALRLSLNARAFLGLFDIESHYAWYPPGASYQVHKDRFHSDDRRVVSCVLYLNHDWVAQEGGALRLYPTDTAQGVEVLPCEGRLVAFSSAEILHEVLPATRDRFSVASWLRRR